MKQRYNADVEVVIFLLSKNVKGFKTIARQAFYILHYSKGNRDFHQLLSNTR